MCIPALLAALLASGVASASMPPAGPAPRPGGQEREVAPTHGPQSPSEPDGVGSLTIRAVQGTPGGPAIGATKVEVHLYGRQGLIRSLERMLDERGTITIDQIPCGDGVQPIVVIHHAGVTYQKSAAVLDPAHPRQEIEVTCFELTEAEPAWSVSMRHVMIEPIEGGLRVVEMLSLANPDERTWLGAPDTSVAPADKRVTTRFTLPHGANNVELGKGFHDWCCTTLAGHGLVNHLPLMPTGTEMTYRYDLAATNGRAVVDIVAPAPTRHLMVIVPQSLTIGAREGLAWGGEQVMNDMAVNYLVASTQEAGAVARVAIDGLGGGAMLASDAAPRASRATVKIVAAAGGGLIVLAGVVVVLVRPARTQEEV